MKQILKFEVLWPTKKNYCICSDDSAQRWLTDYVFA